MHEIWQTCILDHKLHCHIIRLVIFGPQFSQRLRRAKIVGIFYIPILSLIFELTYWNWLCILIWATINYTGYHIEILYAYIKVIYIPYIYMHIYIEFILLTQMMTVLIHLYALQTTSLLLVHSGGTRKLLRVTPDPGSNSWEMSFKQKGIRRSAQK